MQKSAHPITDVRLKNFLNFKFLSEAEGPDYCRNNFFSKAFGKKAFVHIQLGCISFTKFFDVFDKIGFIVNNDIFSVFFENAVRNTLNGYFVFGRSTFITEFGSRKSTEEPKFPENLRRFL